jgi:type I phosphodiesterase/nucleotide pyrophosphatase
MKSRARLLLLTLGCAFLLASGPLARSAGDAFGESGTPTAGSTSSPGAPAKYALVLVLDGLNYSNLSLSALPNLAALVKRGTNYTGATVGALPSITESSHATIGTGVLPSHHGILGDSWRVPGTNRMSPNLLDMTMDGTGYIDNLLKGSSVASLAGIIHGAFRGSVVASLSAHKVYAASAMGGGHADYVAFGVKDSRGHFVPSGTPGRTPDAKVTHDPALDLTTYPRTPGLEDDWAATLGIKMLQEYKPRVLMINFPEPDNAGHAAGPDPKVIGPVLTAFDKSLGRLLAAYRAAGILSQTDVIVTADHGMVMKKYTVNSTTISNIIKSAGGDPLSIGHGDYSPIWLKNAALTPKVAAALAAARIPHVAAVYMKNTQGKYVLVSPVSMLHAASVEPAYSDLLATFDTPASADLVLLYDENTITMTKLYLQINRQGDHEGATWGAQHVPLIAAGPGVKSGYASPFPAHLVDIAPTVETLLGAKPRNQDGVPLADSMTAAPSWATQAQAATTATRTRDVRGMLAQRTAVLQAQAARP